LGKSQFWEREIKGSSLIEHDVLNTPLIYKTFVGDNQHNGSKPLVRSDGLKLVGGVGSTASNGRLIHLKPAS